MATALTARQGQIFKYIEHCIIETGYPPTRAEIAQEFGFKSVNAAEDHLRALRRKGYIELHAATSRGIRLLKPSKEFSAAVPGARKAGSSPAPSAAQAPTDNSLTLPLVGRVAAGSPILAQENVLSEYTLPIGFFSSRPDYLLTVKGMSMRNIGIMDGDLLAVKKTPDATNRSIVVARIDDDVTVKRLEINRDHVRLLPENEDYEPIEIPPGSDFVIEGLAVGLIRKGSMF